MRLCLRTGMPALPVWQTGFRGEAEPARPDCHPTLAAVRWQPGMFADKRVKVSRLPSFRAEHFPYSGPYPWLDRPDALEQIDNKLRNGAITEEEARQCRYWADNGYITIEKLIEDRVLDSVWDAYDRAIREGKIRLEAEPASADDPYPGRFLNPHKKSGAYCQILKHPALLHWIQVLMEREPKPLHTIMSHKGSP